ncbi:glycosyltransferase [Phreatobacter sp.]|uniref:glycosyltransferase n=1 Tax=Phreatobacter sp. TaxID=1966341 RepID=UPI003F70F7B0
MPAPDQSAPSLAVLVSPAAAPCGVEAFARRLAGTAGQRATLSVLGGPDGLPRVPDAAEALVLNLPVVAWKRDLAGPLRAAMASRRAGRGVVLVLHEWADLDWKRRASYLPILPLATAIAFSSPEVARQFAASPASRLATSRRAVVPVPPNLTPPAMTIAPLQAVKLDEARAAGRLVIGHFGSIYPKKQSTAVLDVARALVDSGADPFVAFIGSFVKGLDRVEEDFMARVAALGLEDRVTVTGYVASEAEVFGLFERCDAFVYAFAEGLTSRRGSVLACALSGRPVVVNAPAEAGAFDHHPTYRMLLESGALKLVPHTADASVIAAAVLEAVADGGRRPPVDVEAAWRDALAVVDSLARVA